MSYEVRFSEEAESNILAIHDWIARRSADGASKWLVALESAVGRLAEFADSLGVAPEAAVFQDRIKQILFKTRSGNVYRAIFVLRGQTVHVVSVRGTGQDILKPGELELPE